MRRSFFFWLLFGLLVVAMAGCSGGNNDTNTLGTDPYVTAGGTPTVFARFDPGPQVMPLPNDVVWQSPDNPQTPEVYLAPAAGDSQEMAQLKQLVNAQGLFGLSPNMFLTIPVTGAVNPATLDLLVFRTDDPHLPDLLGALAVGDQAAAGAALAQMEIRTAADFVITTGNGEIKLLPHTPFTPGAAYAVVVRNTLKDALGYPVASSLTMQALKSPQPFAADSPFVQLEALRAAFNSGTPSLFDIVQGVSGAATGTGWTRDDVLVLWTFHTADHTLSLTPTTAGAATLDYPTGGSNPFSDTTASFKAITAGFTADDLQWKDPSTGTYVTTTTPTGIPFTDFVASDPKLTGLPTTGVGNIYFGQFHGALLATGGQTTDTIPFLLTVPSSAEPAGGYPVVVFQHGITASKEAALPLASTLAQAGYAVLAIDALDHGDRTPPGQTSGQDFFTTNLLQDRANIDQAAMDLWETLDVIQGGLDFDGNPGADLDAGRIQFVSQSLGSIIGSVFLSQETRVQRMVLANPSALLLNVLDETSLPNLKALVTSLGYTQGTTPYYVFLDLAQWLLDPVDGAYNGIGGNSTGNLLAMYAYGDPIVANDSTQVFLTNMGLDPANIVSVDPDTVGVSFPAAADFAAGFYQYGIPGKPVIHSFLLTPLFDPASEPWYMGYDPAIQEEATTGAQLQLAGFLSTP